ncbi:MAG: DUF1573 domain-containing protein [Pirellulales bacterium]
MFTERSVDFGSVPRSAKVEHTFVITNLYKDDVHIAGVRTSCGCTSPRIVKDTLKTHEQGAIVAAFNTHSFSGQHGARVTVTIDRPKWAEIELNVKGYIRTDLVLEPGQVSLGSVPEGQTADKKIQITHYGNSDWKVTDVTANSEFLAPSIKETSRANGRVTYELDVQLKDGAPAGYLNDQLVLATNDQTKEFPVMVEGRIVAPLTVSPATLMLGTIAPGQKIVKQIVVKGTKPFTILDVHCENSAFSFDTSAAKEAKAVHMLPVTFTAGDEPGKFTCKIEIITDLGDKSTAQLTAIGHVGAPLASKSLGSN